MTRLILLAVVSGVLITTPGCIALTAADLAIDATGAVVGTAGNVVEGVVDTTSNAVEGAVGVLIIRDKCSPEDKTVPNSDDLEPESSNNSGSKCAY